MKGEASRSQIKREVDHLQQLGEQLIEWPVAKLEGAGLPAKLVAAVLDAKRMTKNTLRRQRLYIGRLLRELEPDELQPVLDVISREARGRLAEADRHHRVERWREQLLTDTDAALAALSGTFARIDADRVRGLVTKAVRENEREEPPVASRQLYRYLRALVESGPVRTAPARRDTPAKDTVSESPAEEE